jgi:hypothetical protein
VKSRSVHPTYRRPKRRVASIVIGCVEALQVLFVAVDRVHLGAFHSLSSLECLLLQALRVCCRYFLFLWSDLDERSARGEEIKAKIRFMNFLANSAPLQRFRSSSIARLIYGSPLYRSEIFFPSPQPLHLLIYYIPLKEADSLLFLSPLRFLSCEAN